MSITQRTTNARLFWTLQLAGWTGYAVALMVPWLGRYPVSVMWSNKLVISVTGLLTSSALRLLYRRVVGQGRNMIVIGSVAIAASVAGAFVWNAVASTILGHSLQNDSVLLGALGRTLPRFDGVLYHSLVLLTWSLLYFGATHYRELVAERERSLRAESLAREARLLALRYQIGPHFLFNALNAISTLVVTDRKADATAMIAQLADLLRVSLQPPVGGLISLGTELEIVRGYVAIEQMRFADRLDVAFDVDPRTLSVPVPAMILQPLVENTVRHAVSARDEPTRVVVRASLDNSVCTVSVSDDGPGSIGHSNGLGVGLTNVRARLEELYGAHHRFTAGASEAGGFSVEIEIPVKPSPVVLEPPRTLQPQVV